MSIGALTFGSLASLSEYRNKLSSTSKQGQAKTSSIPIISPQFPTGPVDARTDQALEWSGIKSATRKGGTSQSALFAGHDASSRQNSAPSYKAPNLDFTYSLASIKGILSYRAVLLARSSEAASTPGENLSEKL